MRSTTTTSMGAFRGSNLRPNAAREVKMELPAGGAIRQFGGDIEVLGSQPVRAYDLIVVHAVGHSDVTPHEEGAAPDHGAINMHANVDFARHGRSGLLNGGDFEFRPRGRGLTESRDRRKKCPEKPSRDGHITSRRGRKGKVPDDFRRWQDHWRRRAIESQDL